MKTRSKLFSAAFTVSAFTFLASCSGDKKEAGEEQKGHATQEHPSDSGAGQQAAEPQFKVDQTFQTQLASVFSSYVELKEALVASDAGKARTEASQTREEVSKVDMKLLSGAAHNDWMNFLKPIQNALNEIESTDNLEAQRKAFSTLSENIYKSVKAFGLGGEEAFYEYCPMAFDNQGAYWLSDEEKIRNPYFGDQMLTCGEVKERLQ